MPCPTSYNAILMSVSKVERDLIADFSPRKYEPCYPLRIEGYGRNYFRQGIYERASP